MAPLTREHGAEPGDLIEIFRMGFQHWGVYIGNSVIVHMICEDPDGDDKKATKRAMLDGMAKVLCENIWDVIGDSDFKVNNHLDDKYESRTPETIVKEALCMVGKKLRYSVIGSNCEHFATYLRYGKAVSIQVYEAVQAALASPAAAIAVGAAASVSASVLTGNIGIISGISLGSSDLATSSRVSAGAVSSQSKALTRPGELD